MRHLITRLGVYTAYPAAYAVQAVFVGAMRWTKTNRGRWTVPEHSPTPTNS